MPTPQDPFVFTTLIHSLFLGATLGLCSTVGMYRYRLGQSLALVITFLCVDVAHFCEPSLSVMAGTIAGGAVVLGFGRVRVLEGPLTITALLTRGALLAFAFLSPLRWGVAIALLTLFALQTAVVVLLGTSLGGVCVAGVALGVCVLIDRFGRRAAGGQDGLHRLARRARVAFDELEGLLRQVWHSHTYGILLAGGIVVLGLHSILGMSAAAVLVVGETLIVTWRACKYLK